MSEHLDLVMRQERDPSYRVPDLTDEDPFYSARAIGVQLDDSLHWMQHVEQSTDDLIMLKPGLARRRGGACASISHLVPTLSIGIYVCRALHRFLPR